MSTRQFTREELRPVAESIENALNISASPQFREFKDRIERVAEAAVRAWIESQKDEVAFLKEVIEEGGPSIEIYRTDYRSFWRQQYEPAEDSPKLAEYLRLMDEGKV